MENFTCCKLEIFIPESHLRALQGALQSVDAGHIGNYDSCMSYSLSLIHILRGDGVGPEKMAAAVEVLQAVCRMYGHELVLREVTAGGEAIERFYNPIPEESLAVCRQVRAVLFGNIGLAKYRNLPIEKRPEYALMRLRREMAVTTNIRPVRLYPQLKALSPLKEALLERGLDYVLSLIHI